ncbi:MAG: hypothetical protein AB7V44_08810 [Pseudonocardia sp.]
MRTTELVVVYDVGCPRCSRIARELPDVVRVPVTVRSCRDPQLAIAHPDVPASVRACARPAIGTRRPDGSVRWWPGLPGAVAAVLPVVRPAGMREAAELLWTALRRSPRANGTYGK